MGERRDDTVRVALSEWKIELSREQVPPGTVVFRVRNKEKTIYCYSEAERDEAGRTLGKTCEITRFKGLGEISPKEFQQFIGEQMRLSQVEYAPKPESANIFSFYMGRNTPERKDYIMENLVVPVEE